MYLIKKINALNSIFREADKHVINFQYHANISCISGCNLCCIKPDIDATIIEFLPGAYNLLLSQEYENILDKINSKTDTMCVFHNPLSTTAYCSHYQNRGLVCRLFGYSAKTTKTGDKSLVTCKLVKQLIEVNGINDKLGYAPEMSNYYLKLYGIDPKLAVQYLPINQAIKNALEIVLFHFHYKNKLA